MRAGTRWLLFGLLFVSCLVLRGFFSDSTVYAPGYSEARFRSIRVGMSREDVIRALGQPRSAEAAPGYVYWTYAPKDYRQPRSTMNGPSVPPPDTTFHADLSGKIVAVYGAYLDVEAKYLLGHRLDEVKERFGEPLEVLSMPDRHLYHYSKLDGIKGHYVRIISISKQGTVCDMNAGCIGYYVGDEDKRHLSWIEWLELHL